MNFFNFLAASWSSVWLVAGEVAGAVNDFTRLDHLTPVVTSHFPQNQQSKAHTGSRW